MTGMSMPDVVVALFWSASFTLPSHLRFWNRGKSKHVQIRRYIEDVTPSSSLQYEDGFDEAVVVIGAG